MKVLLIDDEKFALEKLKHCIKTVNPDVEIFDFDNAKNMLKFASENICDVAFLDIEMPTITGTELARRLKDIQPKINIIFVTGYSEYMPDAFSLRASGYILKPATVNAVRTELDNLRYPVEERHSVGIYVHTFGNFDVFVNGKPIKFSRKPSKEILAYLVDRNGASATVAELASVLFGDQPYDRSRQKQMQVYIADMIKSLKSVNAHKIIEKSHNSISIDISKFTCDYYEFMKMTPWAVNQYHGEYMNNYSWAEFTLGWLENQSKKAF